MEIFPTNECVVRCAVLGGNGAWAVVAATDVNGEYANGEYAFGLTIAKVYGNPPGGAQTFYLISGDLPNGEMLSCVCSRYILRGTEIEIVADGVYDWRSNNCVWENTSIVLPVVCAQSFEAIERVDIAHAEHDEAFDMDVVALLEDCGFWPWDFHFADPNTNFVD